MRNQRRQKGAGSLHFEASSGLWCFATKMAGKRLAVRRRRLCDLLAEVSRRNLWVEPAPRTPRRELMATARSKGTHTPAEWDAYVAARNGVCEYCGRECGTDATKDHRTAVALGGSDALDNLAVACLACNQHKGALNEAEFRGWLAAGGLATIRNRPLGVGTREDFWKRHAARMTAYLDQGYGLEEAGEMATRDRRASRG